MNSQHFFSYLPIHRISLSELLGDEGRFVDVPADWHVIVTDIKNSTHAFRAGRSEEINLIATGSIIATLNLAQKQKTQIPFFFGGDGATLIVPPGLLDPVMRALVIHQNNTRTNYGLELRVGAVSVDELKVTAHELKLSRLYINDVFSIPVVIGTGLSAAERIVKKDIVKKDDESNKVEIDHEVDLDLSGMQCRWDKVKPATMAHEVVSLLVSANHERQQASVFKQVVDLIDDIYGPYESRNPVTKSKLRLKGTFGKIADEMRVKLGRFDLFYLLKNWFMTFFGKLVYFRKEAGKYYITKLVELTDTLVLDGRLNTVIAGTSDQRQRLEKALDKLEQEKKIVYGFFVSKESIMSCYVRDKKDQHIHFVDGSDGGYTMAATMLKQKIAQKG